MRYTRYDIKKKNTLNTFMVCIVIILLLSFFIGSLIFKLAFIETGVGNSVENEVKSGTASTVTPSDYYLIQCGVHSQKNNADELLKKLQSMGNPFEVEDGKYYRVFYGIGRESDYASIAKLLKDSKVDFSRSTITIKNESTSDIETSKIIDAYLEIINKASGKDVQDVQTKSIKSWCSKLSKVNSGDNCKVLEELRAYTDKLPDKVDKSYASSMEVFIYNELKKIK